MDSKAGYIESGAESTLVDGDYEITIHNQINTFISVQNIQTAKCLTFTTHDLVRVDEALKIAKQLIKSNKAILSKRSLLES